MARSSRNLPAGVFDYFITSRCTNKDWFKIPLPEVWDTFSRYLYFIDRAYPLEIRAFVLMSNHFHMLCTSNADDLPPAMNYLLRECSKEINRASGSINQVWGRPYHSTVILSYVHYQNAYKYLFRNPVEPGLCKAVEDYPFSTLRGLLGFDRLIIPVKDELLLGDPEGQLRWLNTPPKNLNYREEFRRGLRKRVMSFGKDKNKFPHPFDREIF